MKVKLKSGALRRAFAKETHKLHWTGCKEEEKSNDKSEGLLTKKER